MEPENCMQEQLDLFYRFVKERQDSIDPRCFWCQSEVLLEADRLCIKNKAVLILCELLLGEHILQELKTHHSLFFLFTQKNQESQRYMLGGLEQVINLHKDSLMSKIPQILRMLYNYDIVEKQGFIDWKVSQKFVTKEVSQEILEVAQPFIDWLQGKESGDKYYKEGPPTFKNYYGDYI